MFETLRRYKEAIGWGIFSAIPAGLVVFGYLTGNKSRDLPFGVVFSVLAGAVAVGSALDTYNTVMMPDLVESFSGVSDDLTRQAGVQTDVYHPGVQYDVYHPGVQYDEFRFIPHPSLSDSDEAAEELVFQ